MTGKQWTTGVVGFLILIALTCILFLGNVGNKYPTALISIIGIVLGWIIAFLSSPYDEKDKEQLTSFSKLIGTFLSGYILSKCDKLFEFITSKDFVFNSVQGMRILLFAGYFGVTWIIVFVFRRYSISQSAEMKKKGRRS